MLLTLFLCGCASTARNRPQNVTIDEAVEQLKAGRKTRINSERGKVEGKFIERDGQALQIQTKAGTVSIAMTTIRSIDVRRTSAGQGAKVGAAAFGVIGILGGFVLDGLAKSLDESDDPEGCTPCIFVGAMAGAASGGLLGGAIGAANAKWYRIYP